MLRCEGSYIRSERGEHLPYGDCESYGSISPTFNFLTQLVPHPFFCGDIPSAPSATEFSLHFYFLFQLRNILLAAKTELGSSSLLLLSITVLTLLFLHCFIVLTPQVHCFVAVGWKLFTLLCPVLQVECATRGDRECHIGTSTSPPFFQKLAFFIYNSFAQCCGSMIFWGGSGSESGSADPYL